MIIPNIWENKKCSKPPTSIYIYIRENPSKIGMMTGATTILGKLLFFETTSVFPGSILQHYLMLSHRCAKWNIWTRRWCRRNNSCRNPNFISWASFENHPILRANAFEPQPILLWQEWFVHPHNVLLSPNNSGLQPWFPTCFLQIAFISI